MLRFTAFSFSMYILHLSTPTNSSIWKRKLKHDLRFCVWTWDVSALRFLWIWAQIIPKPKTNQKVILTCCCWINFSYPDDDVFRATKQIMEEVKAKLKVFAFVDIDSLHSNQLVLKQYIVIDIIKSIKLQMLLMFESYKHSTVFSNKLLFLNIFPKEEELLNFLDGNPRTIKRLCNILLFSLSVFRGDRIDSLISTNLMYVTLMVEQWPFRLV